jgi:hypothetical protein
MKNQLHVLTVLIVVVSSAAHLACTTPPPANTNRPAVNANTASSNSSPAKPAQQAESSSTGSIEVSSVPPGARIVLIATDDDAASEPLQKGMTPTTISGVKPGKYTVDLEKQGYRFYQKEVTVKVGKTVKIAASLKKR